MRADAHELQRLFIGLPVDQYQVWLDVAISVILPVAGQCVIAVTWLQWMIAGQGFHNGHQFLIECGAVLALGLALVVALELAGVLNPPHASPPSAPRRYQSS